MYFTIKNTHSPVYCTINNTHSPVYFTINTHSPVYCNINNTHSPVYFTINNTHSPQYCTINNHNSETLNLTCTYKVVSQITPTVWTLCHLLPDWVLKVDGSFPHIMYLNPNQSVLSCHSSSSSDFRTHWSLLICKLLKHVLVQKFNNS